MNRPDRITAEELARMIIPQPNPDRLGEWSFASKLATEILNLIQDRERRQEGEETGFAEAKLRLEWACGALQAVTQCDPKDAGSFAQAGLDLAEADEAALERGGNDEALASLAEARTFRHTPPPHAEDQRSEAEGVGEAKAELDAVRVTWTELDTHEGRQRLIVRCDNKAAIMDRCGDGGYTVERMKAECREMRFLLSQCTTTIAKLDALSPAKPDEEAVGRLKALCNRIIHGINHGQGEQTPGFVTINTLLRECDKVFATLAASPSEGEVKS